MFDLDGTVYEDMHHFAYYANMLKNKLPYKLQDDFTRDYEQAEAGKLPLKIGRIYDQKTDWILEQKGKQIRQVWDWNGNSIKETTWKKEYKDGITFDMERIFSIGDSWWVPNAIARHYGISSEETHIAFLETREYMMTPEYIMNRIPGLADKIKDLKDRGLVTVLVTNSPEVDSRVIMEKLGLADCFTDFVFRAHKPVKTKEVVHTLCERHGVSPEQILSIGDNYRNEILPILELGGQAIHINIYDIAEDLLEDAPRVNSMKELLEDLDRRM